MLAQISQKVKFTQGEIYRFALAGNGAGGDIYADLPEGHYPFLIRAAVGAPQERIDTGQKLFH